MMNEILLAAAIAAVFLVPALFRPSVGRALVGMLFLGGAVFNLLYTLPNVPRSLLDLVATVPIPPYRDVIGYVLAWRIEQSFVLAVTAFEIVTGSLILWRGSPARIALLVAGAWSISMLPVIPPQGILLGVALTGTPGV